MRNLLKSFLRWFCNGFTAPNDEDRRRVEELVGAVSSWRVITHGVKGNPRIKREIEGRTDDGRTVCLTYQQLFPESEQEKRDEPIAFLCVDPEFPERFGSVCSYFEVRVFIDGQEVEIEEANGDAWWLIKIWDHCYGNDRCASGQNL